MAFIPTNNRAGLQNLYSSTTSQNHALGTIIQAEDPALGGAEFIYLKGVASTAIGDAVIYDLNAKTTTRAVAGSRGQIAISMSANVANQHGWYQISGLATVKSGTVVSGALVYLTSTAGQIDDAVVAGDKIDGAILKSANGTPTTGYAYVQINRASANGNG